ncbi:transcription factor IIS helical bundle-like domain-containing protein [Pseudomonas oryzihabitans]|uniref:transcription factor IIS helical bundle-like domain-containing protein n=1 Tax=Pseudomonas oryzihabitans TaxID=47885 RepID=UPI00289651BC|nr:transcription factor IIS helical bundle-like domain-containing protein [Pseudomonas oryzihabitans]
MKQRILTVGFLLSISAAASAQQKNFDDLTYTYKDDKSPAWNFAAALDNPVFYCGLEATSGATMQRQGASSAVQGYADNLSECQRKATQVGDAAIDSLKKHKPSEQVLALAKDLYSKWAAYMSSLSAYTGEGVRAKQDYRQAAEALRAEDKFSK